MAPDLLTLTSCPDWLGMPIPDPPHHALGRALPPSARVPPIKYPDGSGAPGSFDSLCVPSCTQPSWPQAASAFLLHAPFQNGTSLLAHSPSRASVHPFMAKLFFSHSVLSPTWISFPTEVLLDRSQWHPTAGHFRSHLSAESDLGHFRAVRWRVPWCKTHQGEEPGFQ